MELILQFFVSILYVGWQKQDAKSIFWRDSGPKTPQQSQSSSGDLRGKSNNWKIASKFEKKWCTLLGLVCFLSPKNPWDLALTVEFWVQNVQNARFTIFALGFCFLLYLDSSEQFDQGWWFSSHWRGFQVKWVFGFHDDFQVIWGGLRDLGSSEPNQCKPNQSTYRQFDGEDEDLFEIFWALLVNFGLGIMHEEGICWIQIFGFLRSKSSNLEVWKKMGYGCRNVSI